MDALTFKLNLGLCSTDYINITWSVTRSTEKALLVKTAGGEFWIPLSKLLDYRDCRRSIQPDVLVKLISEVTSTSSDTLHRVWKSGKGKTQKSHKFKIAILRATKVPYFSERIVRRTFTLPTSQIKNEDGKWLAPRWLILKYLAENEVLPRATWPGLAAVTREIDDAVAQLKARIEVENQERQAAAQERIKLEREKQAERVALRQAKIG